MHVSDVDYACIWFDTCDYVLSMLGFCERVARQSFATLFRHLTSVTFCFLFFPDVMMQTWLRSQSKLRPQIITTIMWEVSYSLKFHLQFLELLFIGMIDSIAYCSLMLLRCYNVQLAFFTSRKIAAQEELTWVSMVM